MATIQAGGIGSGIDVNSIVTGLVAAEREGPETILNVKEDTTRARITAFGSLKSSLEAFENSLDDLKDLSSFQSRQATSSDVTLFTATANNSAVVSNYSIEVTQLAEAHKLLSKGFASDVTEVGTGTLTIDVGSESFSVVIDGSNDQVKQIRDAINNASDNKGVTASLVNVDDGLGGTVTKLVLTADDTGLDNQLTISVSGDGEGTDIDDNGLSQLVYDPEPAGTKNMTEVDAAVDAIIKIDGSDDLTVTSSSNQIENAIDGVTLSLLKADAGNPANLSISLDKDAAKEKVEAFVENYNALSLTMSLLANSNSEDGDVGVLVGDATLRNLQSKLRQTLSTQVEGLDANYDVLASIGISTQKDGTLTIDSDTLDDALQTNFDDVGALFADTNGYANTLATVVDSYIESNGLLDLRTQTLNTQLDDISTAREALEDRLDKLEKRLVEQFTAMDILVSNLKSTGEFLSQQFSSLNNNDN